MSLRLLPRQRLLLVVYRASAAHRLEVEPALSLVQKGYLSADDTRQNFTLTPKAKEFLAYDPKPEFEEAFAVASEEDANDAH